MSEPAPTESGRPGPPRRIFVSHVSEDESFTRLLVSEMRRRGIDLWIDWGGLDVGEPHWLKIQQAMDECYAVLAVWSPSADIKLQSGRDSMTREITYARQHGKRVLPVTLDGVPLPMILAGLKTRAARSNGSDLPEVIDELERALLPHRSGHGGKPNGPPEGGTWEFLRRRAVALTQDQLEIEATSGKWDPRTFIDRPAISGAVSAFENAERPVLAIVGDSGQGKTSVLCSLAGSLGGSGVVLFYGCGRSFHTPSTDGVLGRVFSQLELPRPTAALLRTMRADAPPNERLWLLLDAVNEHADPVGLADQLYSELGPLRQEWSSVRVILTCKRDAWDQIRARTPIDAILARLRDRPEVRLGELDHDEARHAYERYRDEYELSTTWEALDPRLQRMLTDPLLMKFTADAFRGREIADGAGLQDVWLEYYEAKVRRLGPGSARCVDVLDAVVDTMWQQGAARVPLSAVRRAHPSLADALVNDDPASPYRQLISAGVLAQDDVTRGLVGREVQVRFVFDRFLEYVLADRLMRDLAERGTTLSDLASVLTLLERGRAGGFAELRGALRWALIDDALKNELGEDAALEALLTTEDMHVRSIAVDVLVALGRAEPERTQQWLTRLASLPHGPAGSAAVLAAYVLSSWPVLETAFLSPVSFVRTTAAGYAYWLCSRYWKDAAAHWLPPFADRVAKAILRREASRASFGLIRQSGATELFDAFLSLSALLSSHLVTDWDATRPFVGLWDNFYGGFSVAQSIAVRLAKKKAGDLAVEGYERGGEVITMKTLSRLFELPRDDPLRLRTVELARSIEPPPNGPSTVDLADELITLSELPDGAISLLLVAVLTPRIQVEPARALQVLRDMHAGGAAMAKYTALRTATSAMLCLSPLDRDYVTFVSESVLEDWRDGDLGFEVAGDRKSVGHLMWPLLFESMLHSEAPLPFVTKFLAAEWSEGRDSQVLALTRAIGEAALRAFAVPGAQLLPLLQSLTIALEHTANGRDSGAELRATTIRALARMWPHDPEIVEAFLVKYPQLLDDVHDFVATEDQAKLFNFAGQLGFVAFLTRPETRAAFQEVTLRIYGESTSARDGVRHLAAFMVAPETLHALTATADVDRVAIVDRTAILGGGDSDT